MIGYIDTSALVPLVIAEPTSARCGEVWQAFDTRVSSLLVVAEARAALAQALRLGRLTQESHACAAALLDRRLDELALVVPTRSIMDRAGELAVTHALRGYDAVHLASALTLASDGVVLVSGDRALLDAATALGLATADVTQS